MFFRKHKAKISELEIKLQLEQNKVKTCNNQYNILQRKLIDANSALSLAKSQEIILRSKIDLLEAKLNVSLKANEILKRDSVQRDSKTGRFLSKKK